MDLNQYLEKMEEIVIQPMISFMDFCDEDDCEYTLEDVQTCKDLISAYLEKLASMKEPEDEAIMEEVKILVLALNELNEKTDYVLIETEAREAIWEVVQTSAIDCGLKEYDDDITGEWREW